MIVIHSNMFFNLNSYNWSCFICPRI